MIEDFKIDIRKEFELLQREFSISILLIRNNKNTRCRCYDPLHKDGDRECKICGGTGRVSSIEKVDVIHQNVDSNGFAAMTELGLTVSNTIVLYFDSKSVPKVNDQVLIVGYDEFGSPVDIKKSCTVYAVHEVRGDSGRIEYYHVYAKYSPEKIAMDQKRLNAIPPASKLQIAKGKRYTWPQR